MEWIKKIAVPVLLSVISIVVTLVLMEGLIRLTPYGNLVYEGIMFPHNYFESDPAGYDITPNAATTTLHFTDGAYPIWSNSLGCFDIAYNGETPYTLLIGDSFAWGFTPLAEKWGTVIQNYTGERVLKCGVPGYGTKQELLKATKLLAQLPHPQLLLVAYYDNDRADDSYFPNSLVYNGDLLANPHVGTSSPAVLEQALAHSWDYATNYCMAVAPAHPMLQRVKCFLRRNSALYLLVQAGIKKVLPAPLLRIIGIVNDPVPEDSISIDDSTTKSQHLQNILGFKQLAEQEKIPLLFVMMPVKGEPESGKTTYTEVETFMSEEGIQFYDPLSDVVSVAKNTRDTFFWHFDPHMNPAGNRLIGLLTTKYILTKTNVYVTNATSTELQSTDGALKKEFSY